MVKDQVRVLFARCRSSSNRFLTSKERMYPERCLCGKEGKKVRT